MEDIIFSEKSGVGIIDLNRPQVLNALNYLMFKSLKEKLIAWENNHDIKAVLIKAVPGRAFCAGGDVRSLYERKQSNELILPEFFTKEYSLNKHIFHYKKPYISLLDGITMGGGAGISIHGSYRIGTKNLLFAMPEAALGFFTDTGATYFLSRLPNKIGFFLGLTTEHIAYQDCYALGLIDAVIPSESQDAFIKALTQLDNINHTTMNKIINQFSTTVPEALLKTHHHEIENAFSKNTVEEIIDALEKGSEWAKSIAEKIKTHSPTSLKVILASLKRAEKMDFDQCMAMEDILMSHFIQSHDLYEGIRAILVDKDRSPHWQPARLEDISQKEVESYFTR